MCPTYTYIIYYFTNEGAFFGKQRGPEPDQSHPHTSVGHHITPPTTHLHLQQVLDLPQEADQLL